MISLQPHFDGVVLPIRAQPGARKARIIGGHNGALKVAVTAPPEEGRANDAIGELLCKALRLKRSQVVLIAGATSREKRVLLRGVTIQVAETAISLAIAGG